MADHELIEAVSFVVVEQILLWLSSLSDEERAINLEALTKDEKSLCHVMVREFYLARPEMERQFRTQDAYKLLKSALTQRGHVWVSQRWDQVAAVIASIASILSKKTFDEESGFGAATEGLLKSLKGGEPLAGRSVLSRLVQLVQIFGFSGVFVFVDKVDETEITTNSAESTTKLIYPLISHIQLLEVDGFAWEFFLWSKVKSFFESEDFTVRLDKIANSVITWDQGNFRKMLDERLKYFSGGSYNFASLFSNAEYVERAFNEICLIAMGSPRELVKIMDVIIREHDSIHSDDAHLLNDSSVERGLDKYVTDVINTIFNERSLGQIYRLKKSKFINKDVQSIYRVGDQSARAKIKAWEDAGLVRFIGTRAAEGDLGGKPANEYAIADARIERIMRRDLVQVEEFDLDPSEANTEPYVSLEQEPPIRSL